MSHCSLTWKINWDLLNIPLLVLYHAPKVKLRVTCLPSSTRTPPHPQPFR